jgi:hypothetical protein
MPSELAARTFFLTYPQTTFSIDDDYHKFLEHVRCLGPTSYACVGVEKHADGSDHFHALVDYQSKIRVSNAAFNWRGRHPNVKCVGKTKSDYLRVFNYVRKDGNFKEEGQARYQAKQNVWSEVAKARSEEEALELIRQQQPRDFILNRRNIDYALSRLFATPPATPYQGRAYNEFLTNEELEEWRSASFL